MCFVISMLKLVLNAVCLANLFDYHWVAAAPILASSQQAKIRISSAGVWWHHSLILPGIQPLDFPYATKLQQRRISHPYSPCLGTPGLLALACPVPPVAVDQQNKTYINPCWYEKNASLLNWLLKLNCLWERVWRRSSGWKTWGAVVDRVTVYNLHVKMGRVSWWQ